VRVSLAKRVDPAAEAPALLHGAGAAVMLGATAPADGLVAPIVPAADTLFGPRGAALVGPDGPLVVADTGHHRLLVWKQRPRGDGAPADLLVGQRDFSCEGRNGKGEVGAATLNVPTGVSAAGGVLAVADAWNHRVLLWHNAITRANQPADVVLGQAGFADGLANRGRAEASADTLNWCYGVLLSQGGLFVADTGNRRVLFWERVPERSGAPADLVLGQRDFVTRDENGGAAPGPVGMRWPHAVAVLGEALFVTDAGNNRVMVWQAQTGPRANGQPCDFVLGQADAAQVDHNRGTYYPTAASLNMPYGITSLGERLVVADTASSRLLGFAGDALAGGAPAERVAGQRRFVDKGDNRWGAPARDSLCWPYGVAGVGNTLVIADSGNNRVLLWEAAP
jgi:hypothetical protein